MVQSSRCLMGQGPAQQWMQTLTGGRQLSCAALEGCIGMALPVMAAGMPWSCAAAWDMEGGERGVGHRHSGRGERSSGCMHVGSKPDVAHYFGVAPVMRVRPCSCAAAWNLPRGLLAADSSRGTAGTGAADRGSNPLRACSALDTAGTRAQQASRALAMRSCRPG